MARRSVQIEIKNLAGARALFSKVRELGEDPQELLEIAGGILEASTRRRFDEGEGPGGIPWPPSKRAIRQSGKTLVDTGLLLGSIRYEVRPGQLEIGVDGLSESAKNAKSHQFGVNALVGISAHSRTINEAFGIPLPAPRVVNVKAHNRNMKIPARPFLGVDEIDRQDVKDEWKQHLRRLING
jgi:phage gpG-like protein